MSWIHMPATDFDTPPTTRAAAGPSAIDPEAAPFQLLRFQSRGEPRRLAPAVRVAAAAGVAT
jgi:hypothetical protein